MKKESIIKCLENMQIVNGQLIKAAAAAGCSDVEIAPVRDELFKSVIDRFIHGENSKELIALEAREARLRFEAFKSEGFNDKDALFLV